jgi:hypothetical protein
MESLVGWAKARSAVPTKPPPSVGTLRFAHPTAVAIMRVITLRDERGDIFATGHGVGPANRGQERRLVAGATWDAATGR